MKQITVRLSDRAADQLEKIKSMYDENKNSPAVEKAVDMHVWYVNKVNQKDLEIIKLQEEMNELKAIIKYLEEK
jgi:hypothetical protein